LGEIVIGGRSKLAIKTLDFTNINYNKKIKSLNPMQSVKYCLSLLTLKVPLVNCWNPSSEKGSYISTKSEKRENEN
jgi:hypothetical protein